MKKYWSAAIGVTAVAALGLTGCVQVPADDSGDSQVLTAVWEPAQQVSFDAVVAAFEKANPGVEINVTYSPSENLKASLVTQLASGTGPDLMFLDPGQGNANSPGQLGASGYLADLSDSSWIADVPENLRTSWQHDGKTLMLALSTTSIGAIYNDQAMAEIGATPPTTWDGLLEFCRSARGQDKVAYAWAGAQLWANQSLYLTLAPSLVYQDNQDWNADRVAGTTTFADTPGWVETFDKQKEMIEAGCFDDNASGISLQGSIDSVAQHKALGTIQVALLLSQFTKAAPNDSFTLTAVPATNDPAKNLLTTSTLAGIGVNAKSTKGELAKKFVDFLAEPAQMNLFSTASGMAIPPIQNDEFDYSDPNIKRILDAANADVVVPFVDQGWPAPAIKEGLDSMVQSVFATGSPSTRELLARLDGIWDSSK